MCGGLGGDRLPVGEVVCLGGGLRRGVLDEFEAGGAWLEEFDFEEVLVGEVEALKKEGVFGGGWCVGVEGCPEGEVVGVLWCGGCVGGCPEGEVGGGCCWCWLGGFGSGPAWEVGGGGWLSNGDVGLHGGWGAGACGGGCGFGAVKAASDVVKAGVVGGEGGVVGVVQDSAQFVDVLAFFLGVCRHWNRGPFLYSLCRLLIGFLRRKRGVWFLLLMSPKDS